MTIVVSKDQNQDLQTNWHLIIEKIRTYKNILSDIRLEIIKYKQVKKECTVTLFTETEFI